MGTPLTNTQASPNMQACSKYVSLYAGVLHYPESGFFAIGCAVVAFSFTHRLVQPFFFHAALQLQIEAKDLLAHYPDIGPKAQSSTRSNLIYSFRSLLAAGALRGSPCGKS